MSGLGFHTQKMCRQSKMEQLENLTIRQLGNGQEKKTKQHSNPCESAEEKGKSVHRGWGENQNQLQQSAKHLYFWSDILFAEIMHSCLSRDYTHIIQPWKQKDRETPIGKISYLCYRRKKKKKYCAWRASQYTFLFLTKFAIIYLHQTSTMQDTDWDVVTIPPYLWCF